MSARRGSLVPAHKGYRYQDIATAYVLVRAVVERYGAVVVDRKEVEDDRIDDLEVVANGRRVRRQFKSSQNVTRALSEKDFIATKSSLRIDRLVLTHVRAGDAPADEYRLCATWAPPASTDPIDGRLEPIVADPTLEGWPSRHYRLRGEEIWPAGGAPLWDPLDRGTSSTPCFGRAEFLDFCRRFVIELSLPVASTVLSAPGPLERALTDELADRVGIGRYPNHDRSPTDVAALAISLANLARTQEASLTPAEVERGLDIRVDFGRVSQAFPLDEAVFHDRPAFRRALFDAALAGKHQIVVAPPGAGKSWELTRLADELKAAGALVPRHYCYLEPGDDLVERRVTTDVFFGNLLGELHDADPTLVGSGGARYATGISELEAALGEAAESGRPVVVIVDGLDHISRVQLGSGGLSDDDTDIVERLATLDLPDGVALLIGSQPGPHLDPLRLRWPDDLSERPVPPWSLPDLASLADRHGVAQALAGVGLGGDDVARVKNSLAERAEGNPLYARYLARGLVKGLRNGSVASPGEWIAEAPTIDGDVAVYYGHLYRSASAQAQAIADLLGAIDFSVTENDLREMVPSFVGDWVPPALAQLAPVLTASTGQGGVRVFHESFRRFMTQELARQGRSTAGALEPVIEWLADRGFYEDAKAYRFLLPALRRAGRGGEVLARVGVTFVSDSVAQAHPLDAIRRNLSLAADVAAELRDWPALVRCTELHRAAMTCFDESQNEWDGYWETYLVLFGPDALSERLLFDGRPTLGALDGLHACSLVDDAGGTAPWSEYLALHGSRSIQLAASSVTSDPNGALTSGEAFALTVIHGRARLGGLHRTVWWLVRHLNDAGDEFRPLFIRRLAARLARVVGVGLVERLAQRADPERPAGPLITGRAAAVLRLGIADEYARDGDLASAQEYATRAMADADTPKLASACVSHGAPLVKTAPRASPPPPPTSLRAGISDSEVDDVRAWMASLHVSSTDPATHIEATASCSGRVNGPGWYPCWLRFVIALSGVEASRRSGNDGDIGGAFAELTKDTHPFRGTPRACDLWAIRRVIRESIEWGLSLLQTEADWRGALAALTTASRETASRLDREDGGPIPTGTLLDVLTPYASAPIGGSLVLEAIEREMERRDHMGTYYPTHAEFDMQLARARQQADDMVGAREAWDRCAVLLCGYGWRKDQTVFDVIQTTPTLLKVSEETALQALADTQPLANAVVAHTDGRSTKHAPNAWLRKVLEVHLPSGMAVLARTMMEEDGPGGWPTTQAIQEAASAAQGVADPALLDALLATVRLTPDSDADAARRADERLAPVLELLSVDPPLATRSFRRVAAEASGDGRQHTDAAAERVAAVAAEHDVDVPYTAVPDPTPPPTEQSGLTRPPRGEAWRLPDADAPPFVPNATFVDLLRGLRHIGSAGRWGERGVWDRVTLALGYYLAELADEGREDDARRLLRFFARDVDAAASLAEHPLGRLATAMEAAGHARLAATAYALAYTATRGSGGWYHMGDETHGHLMERAIDLAPKAARQVLADEVAYALRGSWYRPGTSRHLIERLAGWGDRQVAEAAWRESFAVVRHRLPLTPADGWFARLRDDREPEWPPRDWSPDEATVALLLARVGDPRLAQKVNALAGVARAIVRRPDAVTEPMRWWLTRNAHAVSVLLIFDLLGISESEPYTITVSLEDELRAYAACGLWGVSRLAKGLLERTGRDDVNVAYGATEDGNYGTEEIPVRRKRALLAADVGGVLDDLEPYWPDLPGQIAHRLSSLFDVEAHRERAQERYRVAWGRDGDAYPPTPTLLWDVELFEVALHERLCGLAERLWTTGQWGPDLEGNILRRVLPRSRVHLGIAASRTARPDWPLAEAVTDGRDTLSVVGQDDPAYEGWTRLALVERQYVADSERSYGPPTEEITVFAGAVAVPLGMSVPPGAMPFMDGDPDGWWGSGSAVASSVGPLVTLTRVTDWLGDALLIVPPTWLREHAGLRFAPHGAALSWHDSDGNEAVALRTWWIRSPEGLFAEPAACLGSDLVVRPDIFERLRRVYRAPLHELRRVSRRPVPKLSEA